MNWLYWSDSYYLYHSLTWTLWLIVLVLVFVPLFPGKTGTIRALQFSSSALFLLVSWLYIFTARWPGLFGSGACNPDEDQLLAAAKNLTQDIVFFRSAECGSSGPMNVYPLLLSFLAGSSPSFFSGRLIALFMVSGSITALYLTAKAAFSESVARAGAFASATLLGSTYFWDFRHYSSEHAPVFYLSVGWAATAWLAVPNKVPAKWRMPLASLGAVFLSLVPLAKLQGIYLALFSSLLLMIVLALTSGITVKQKAREMAVAVLAGFAAPVLFVLLFLMSGVLEYAWLSYIGNALAYQGPGSPLLAKAQLLYGMLANEGPLRATDMSLFVTANISVQLLLLAALVIPAQKPASILTICFTVAGFGMALITAYTVTSTMRNYPHYLFFLPLPLIFASVALLQCNWERWDKHGCPGSKFSRLQLFTLFAFLLILALPVAEFRRQNPHPHVGTAKTCSTNRQVSLISQEILNAAKGGNHFLVVWGYNPKYYSETGLFSATRLSTSSAIFNDNNLRAFFLKTYLDDLKKNRPTVFVDAVAPEQFLLMTNRATQGHEQVPEIRKLVEKKYVLAKEIEGVRIYRTK